VNLFGFTHRTFLEYFAAVHLLRSSSEQELIDLVAQKFVDPSWQMVCQIIVQKAPEKRRGLEDTIVSRLTELLPQLAPSVRPLGSALCLRLLESMPLRPASIERIVNVALDEFEASLPKSSTYPVALAEPAAGREAYWLDGDKIAVENHRIAGRLVQRRLNESLVEETEPMRPLAHLLDFFVTQSCAPATLHHLLVEHSRRRVTNWLRARAWEAWTDAAIPLLGLHEVTQKSAGGSLAGNLRSGCISSIQSPWQNRPLPNMLESSCWLVAWASGEVPDGSAALVVRNARQALQWASYMSPGTTYLPHPIWHGVQDAPPRRATMSDEVEILATLSALVLVEHSLASCNSAADAEALVDSYLSKPWGALRLVKGMLQLRYRPADGPIDIVTQSRLRQLGLQQWCNDNSLRAAQFLQYAGPRPIA